MLAALLASAALAFTEADADFAHRCASNLVERYTPRDAGTPGGHRAANWILDTASRTGANVRRDRFPAQMRLRDGRLAERKFTNVYATFRKAPEAPWVVLVSHYDTKPGANCPGANDGASTTGLLIALAAILEERGYEGKANVLLLWLDGEECVSSYGANDGLWGSRRAANELTRRGMNVRSVVCLDMLGDRGLDITMPANGSTNLMKIVQAAAQRAKVPVTRIPETMRDDHVPFAEAGFPSVDLIDFTYGSAPGLNDWWHTPEDTTDKISRESLLKSGRLVTELLNILVK